MKEKGLVLGFFDGIHKAHKAVITSAFDYADEVVVITFLDSPSIYFGKNAEYILSRKNSLEKMYSLGVKEIIKLDFANIATMSAEKYLDFLVKTYNPKSISTGFNHTFGLNKTGNTNFLKDNQKKYGYKYICVPPIRDNNKIISSSLIREKLTVGDITYANYLLDSSFILEGIVVHGAKIGRTIGFPTANIKYPEKIVKIPFGVYKVLVQIDDNLSKKYSAIMNWGMKPTVNNTLEPIVEVHILEFNENLYDKYIKIEVIQQIRAEKKFSGLNELKEQIKKDIEKCLES